jgi:hypothetical protein
VLIEVRTSRGQQCHGYLPANPVGLDCGSAHINIAFIQWMKNTFKEAHSILPSAKRSWHSKFMISFEKAKREFDGMPDGPDFEIFPIDMESPSSRLYDAEEKMVNLPR